MEKIDCLVPAAGCARRMGRWKPVLPFRGSTIIETVVARALEACARVILVTGFRGEELALLFDGKPRVLVVENTDWELGMFSSIRRGAGFVATERLFVALGDMPFVDPGVYEALRLAPAADAVFPVFGGRRGHPVLFRGTVREAVLREDPASGRMAEIASRFAVREVQWPDDTILRDIDTMEDFA